MIGGTLVALVAAVVLRLTLTGEYLRFVQPGMRPWLLLSGGALAVLAVLTVARALRPAGPDGHEHEPREGWLVLAPVVALLLIAPPALGSYGVDRAAPVRVTSPGGGFPPLPEQADPVPMSLLEYGQRSFDGGGRTLGQATVRLTGFVAGGADAGSFRLARFQIACCAADAAAAVVRILGISGAAPPRDRWVEVTGRYGVPEGDTPVLTALTVQPIPPPADPYE